VHTLADRTISGPEVLSMTCVAMKFVDDGDDDDDQNANAITAKKCMT